MLSNILYALIFAIGSIAAIILLLEIASLILLRNFIHELPTKELRKRILMNPFFEKSDSYGTDTDWRDGYNEDIEKIFTNSGGVLNKWCPLGLWSAPRYYGQHVNIDKYNLRRTVTKHKKELTKSSYKICFFGGSLVWGWGVRDNGTIPSQLLSLRKDIVIENHGQLGYVSSQSLIAFIQRVKCGSLPNLVVSIEGLNDIYSAYQSGVCGIEQNAISRKQLAEKNIPKNLIQASLQHSNLMQLIKSTFCYNKEKINRGNSKYLNERLARSVIDIYNKNIHLISVIAASYNIKVLFIWHPTIFDKHNLTKYEMQIFNMLSNFAPFYRAVRKVAQSNNGLDRSLTIDLSELFSKERQPIFIDPWHYNEYANNLLAKKINEIIISRKLID